MGSGGDLARWVGALALALWVVGVGVISLPGVMADSATPAATMQRAGLVIQHADDATTYALVAFPEDEISGYDLLERSGVEMLSVPFGALGEAVCQLEGEGCGAAECRRTLCQTGRITDPYWRYYGQVEPGVWRALDLGASGTRVRDGDIHAWVWGSGETDLPAVTLETIAGEVGLADGEVDQVGADGNAPVAVVRSGRVSDARAEEATGPWLGVIALVGISGLGAAVVWWRRVGPS